MYTAIYRTKKGSKTYSYLKLVEGKRVGTTIQKTIIHNFGRVDDKAAAFITNLVLKIKTETKENILNQIQSLDAKLYALPTAIYTICQKDLMLDHILSSAFAETKITSDVVLFSILMIIHRIIDPDSKLALTRWYKHIALPVELPSEIDVSSFYYTLDYLMDKKEEIEKRLYVRLLEKGLIEATIVFYDLTSSYFEGVTVPMSKKGYSRDHRPECKQITLGLVIDKKNRLPLYHEVFEGNRKDCKTVEGVLKKLKSMFLITNVIFVADKGMLTPDTLKLLSEHHYQSILSESVRNAFSQRQRRELFARKDTFEKLKDEEGEDILWYTTASHKNGTEVILCYSPQTAYKAKQTRDVKLKKMVAFIRDKKEEHAGDADDQELTRMVFAKLVEKKIRKYFVTKKNKKKKTPTELFTLKKDVVTREEYMDGMWIVKSSTKQLSTKELITTYKDLKMIEAAFRTLKNVIELRPIGHHKDERVKGHVFICILAFLAGRLLEMKTGKTLKMIREDYTSAVMLPLPEQPIIVGGQDLLSKVQA